MLGAGAMIIAYSSTMMATLSERFDAEPTTSAAMGANGFTTKRSKYCT